MSAPLFSVVIPTYNRAGLLKESLASLWTQRFTDFQVIVADDGSTDETRELVRAYTGRVTWCRQDHRGPGAARNLGASRASGGYLAFLDSDDIWFPWTLETYARIIADASQPAFVIGTPTYFTSPDELSSIASAPVSVQLFADYYASQEEWRWWGASALVIRRDAFERVGGFATEWINGEDADLAMRLGVAGRFVHVSAPSTFGYRSHADTAMADFDRTLDGAWHMIDTERRGGYPGGARRALARRRIVARHLRSVMLDAVRRGRHRDAWAMYRATSAWHVRLGRWRFLLGFPLIAAKQAARRSAPARNAG